MRVVLRETAEVGPGIQLLREIAEDPRHEFWTGVIGHRQVTDAYVAELARFHNGELATIDKGLASLHQDVAVVVR